MMKNVQPLIKDGVQHRGDNMKYTYRTVNDKQVVFKITAEENMKLTKDRTFFTDEVYLSLYDSPDNYEEVDYNVWKYFVEEIPNTEVDKLQNQINELQEDKDNLEFVLLNTDFRLTCMELKDEGILE